MMLGERAALEGLLVSMAPALAIEIGTAQGGSLDRIAAHSAEVHSFDLVAPARDTSAYPHVTFHTGDSHELLPAFLADLAEQGRRVDFVLVDGDHTTQGARRDLEDLLASPSATDAVLLVHDTMNEFVREGLHQALSEPAEHVVYVDLDFVPGYLVRSGPFRHQLWGGLGLVVCDAAGITGLNRDGEDVRQGAYELLRPLHDAVRRDGMPDTELSEAEVVAAARHGGPEEANDLRYPALEAELDAARAEAVAARAATAAVVSSKSWRITAPLRAARQRVGTRRRQV